MAGFLSVARKKFSKEIPRRIPPFLSPALGTQGRGLMFSAHVSDDLYFFLYVTAARDAQRFTIEMAWNSIPEFPFSGMPESVFHETGEYRQDALLAVSMRTRIRCFLKMREDYWWGEPQRTSAELMEEFASLSQKTGRGIFKEKSPPDDKFITELVVDACDRVLSVIVPYFDLVAKAHDRDQQWQRLRKQ
ncbi:MAG TPA: hypothetical protein VG269_03090 [Tepidisphaeraceae bacterium]|jgi:hypothetical protein|nr:hypothetical protein [Tepidisphaeraceae bacterium]